MNSTFCGSLRAPEIFVGEQYSAQKADVWSMGVILYTMCTGRFPFDHTDPLGLKGKITRAEPEYPDHFSPELTGLLRDLLKKQPDDGPKMEVVADYACVGQYQRCWGGEPLNWDSENLRRIDEPEIGSLRL